MIAEYALEIDLRKENFIGGGKMGIMNQFPGEKNSDG